MKSNMKRGVAFICTAFILLSSGYAQSHRVGAYLTPQYSFFNKKDKVLGSDISMKGKGFAFNGGAYYERNWGAYGLSIGLGYAYMGHTFTSPVLGFVGLETTHKMNFVSPSLGGNYELNLTDNLLLNIQAMANFNFLVSAKGGLKGNEIAMDLSEEKRFYPSISLGIGCTYLFSDNVGISLLPTFSITMVLDPDKPTYLGVGAQIRFFYAFGY